MHTFYTTYIDSPLGDFDFGDFDYEENEIKVAKWCRHHWSATFKEDVPEDLAEASAEQVTDCFFGNSNLLDPGSAVFRHQAEFAIQTVTRLFSDVLFNS